MNLQQPVSLRTAIVVVLVILYTAALVALIAASRQQVALAGQVKATEATLAQATVNMSNSAPALQADLRAAQERLAALQARLPKDLQTEVFDRAAADAQNSGISAFSYQRKGEYQETLQAGVYKVYRYTISGRGSQDKIMAFLDGLQKEGGPTMIVENVNLTAAGKEWQMSADIVVYTAGA